MQNDRDRRTIGILGCWIAIALAVTLVASGALAEQKGAVKPKATPPAKVSAPAAAGAGEKTGLYDIDASGTDVKFVLEALARRSGANIVVSPEITGEISAHLKQMPIESILDYLSTVQGFRWRKTDDTYLVASKDKLDKPAQSDPTPTSETLIWKCRHIKASDLSAMLTKLYPDVKIVEGPGSYRPQLEAGQSGSAMDSSLGGSQSTSMTSQSSSSTDTSASTIVLIGPGETLEEAKVLLTKLDAQPPQVSIDVAVTEVNSDLTKELGVDWSWSGLSVRESSPSGIGFGKFSKSGMTFTGTIKALVNDGSAKLLAQPNIAVMDGAYAEILIGDRILFPKLVSQTQSGSPIYDTQEERVGIYLQISVRVTEQDDIVMTVYPQVSLVTSYLETAAGSYPQISTREARTTVSVKNGTTLAIGGLLKNNEIKSGTSVPLLGKLPVIGGLFRRGKTTTEHTELVIFLTPKIVKQD